MFNILLTFFIHTIQISYEHYSIFSKILLLKNKLLIDSSHLFFVAVGGIVEDFAFFSKAGTVAGAIPGMLKFVVAQSTAKMWTPGSCRRDQPQGGFKQIDAKL